ncbi:MAG: stalk domain-containing protein [Clostridiales bacterium]|nr:stalk domain-containing protein [Eubacteriales bacterium]MDH7566266.1 stalk domain-containing protein [Clostridiales bacterium]
MKKLLCLLISTALILSCSVTNAFAKDKNQGRDYYVQQVKYSDGEDMDSLKSQLKKYFRDAEKRKAIIKKINNLEQQTNKLESQLKGLKKQLMCFVNGEELSSDVPPVIKYGRTLVPVRALTTALGAEVKWDPQTHVVTIIKDGKVIELTLGSNVIKINGKETTIEVPAENMNNRIVVPIRFIAENFNQKVEWDEETGSIIIIRDGEDDSTPPSTDTNPSAVSVNDSTTGTGSGQFEYVGDWSYGYQTGAYNNDNHWSVSEDAYYRVRFNGTQIKLYGAKDPGFGIAAVSIDNKAETMVDLYSPTRSDNVLLYTSPVLTSGEHIVKVRVTGEKNNQSSSSYINADRVEIISAAASDSSTNLALGKEGVSSSNYNADHRAEKAFDGNASTYWSSQFSDPQWIYVDLGTSQSIARIKLRWETAYGKSYKIQVSNDASDWTDVYSTAAGNGDIDNITFAPVSARYVRVYCIQRGTNYGYSLYEFEVYNQ